MGSFLSCRYFAVLLSGAAFLICCRKSVEDPINRADHDIRKSDHSGSSGDRLHKRIAELGRVRQKSTLQSKDVEAMRAAGILVELFYARNIEGLATLQSEAFSSGLGLSYEMVGAEFVRLIDVSEWRQAFEFLAQLESREGYEIFSGSMAEALVVKTLEGTALYGQFEGEFTARGAKVGAGSFGARVWGLAGEMLTASHGEEKLAELLKAGRETTDAVGSRNLLSGLTKGLREAVNLGDPSNLSEVLDMLPAPEKLQVVGGIASGVYKINSGNLPAFRVLMKEMVETDGLRKSAFEDLGSRMDEDVFRTVFLGVNREPLTGEMTGVVRGWVAKQPKRAVEQFYEAGETEILRPGFQAWMEVDSIEASGWLASKPAGPERDICTEELCGYLVTKGAEQEAKAWLLQLPIESQERVKEKYGFK
jgi:hypothetical protein